MKNLKETTLPNGNPITIGINGCGELISMLKFEGDTDFTDITPLPNAEDDYMGMTGSEFRAWAGKKMNQ